MLVIDQLGSANLLGGVLFKVDASTGQRTVLSDFNDANQGALGVNPWGVAIGSSGNILIIDAGDFGGGVSGRLFSVDAATGQRTVLSDFGDAKQGALGVSLVGVAVVPPDFGISLTSTRCSPASFSA